MARSTVVKVGISQMECGEDPERNLARQLSLTEKALKKGAKIFCTQELFRSQYFCQVEDHRFFALAESIPGPSTDAFSKLARKYKAVIIASLFERRAAGVYHNTAVVIDTDGSLMGVYRKMHIPDDPLFYEKFYFTPGDTGFIAWKTKVTTIGTLVCWDQWFPEGARLTAMQGAEILFYPTAIGSEPQDADLVSRGHWQRVMQGHAGANLMPLVASNRTGFEQGESCGITFYGSSFIAGPKGDIIAEASEDEETVLTAEFDLEEIRLMRASWGLFRDRRPELYTPLLTLDGGDWD